MKMCVLAVLVSMLAMGQQSPVTVLSNSEAPNFSVTVSARIVDVPLDATIRIGGHIFKVADLILAYAAALPTQQPVVHHDIGGPSWGELPVSDNIVQRDMEPQKIWKVGRMSNVAFSEPDSQLVSTVPMSNTAVIGNVVNSRLAVVSVSRQPLAIFTIALGSKLKSIAGYSVRTCEASLTGPISISGGRIAQWIEANGLPVIPVNLAAAAATEARMSSKLYKTAQLTTDISYYMALLIGAGTIHVGMTGTSGTLAQRAARLAPAIIGHETEKAKDSLGARLPDPIERFKGQVLTDEVITLQPGDCRTLLFMGQYLPDLKTLSGTVEGHS